MADTKKLFQSVVTKLSDIIENGETVLDKEGNAIHQVASAAYFAQAINVLKMVGETGKGDKPTIKKQLQGLALPFSSPEDELDHPRH